MDYRTSTLLPTSRPTRHTSSRPSCDCGRERRVELSWQAPLKLPHERDRTVALMAHVRGRPEAPERSVGRAQPGEEHNVRPVLALPDIPLSHHAGGSRRGLALPVDE